MVMKSSVRPVFLVFGIASIVAWFSLVDIRPSFTPMETLFRPIYIGRTIIPEPTPPRPTHPIDGAWQRVRSKFFVFSAFLERRVEALIRIIAIKERTRREDGLYCHLWIGNQTFNLTAKIQVIREHHNGVYSAAFVLCLLHGTGLKPGDIANASVAVVSTLDDHTQTKNWLQILDTQPRKENQDKIHACVRPFFSDYPRADWLVEWFEINRLLGVSHFYMYNRSMSQEVACIVDSYRREGLVTLLPWQLPSVSWGEMDIRADGQSATSNDCLYRSMSHAGWLLCIDIDELVLPRKNETRTLQELLRGPLAVHPLTASLLFRNAFFYADWEDDLKAPQPLLSARKTRRQLGPHKAGDRSKFLVRTSDAIELGTHFTYQLMPGHTERIVPLEDALLHHYRMTCEGLDCLSRPSTMDRTAHHWSAELWRRVVDKNKKLASQSPGYRNSSQQIATNTSNTSR